MTLNCMTRVHLVYEYQQLLNVCPGDVLAEMAYKAGHQLHNLMRNPAAYKQ